MRWILLVVAACRTSPHAAPIANASSRPEVRCARPVMPDDLCPYLPAQCMADYDPNADNDGCPDTTPPEIAFPIGSVDLPPTQATWLDHIASDIEHLAPSARIVVVGEADAGEPELAQERADAVVAALAMRCTPRDRLTTEHHQGKSRVVIRVERCK